ncbi:zinc finger protein RFP-like [Gopherus evgoodei]|uniref:zinc finger protein RFP-like n=1 Tax=Gopherus evgoodei TaxID=1825980 RepID=UPI0011D02FD2|nr:zinc finger protein RFP-like [Gopherus evgoodei]
MATEDPVEHLQDEVACPICLEYFKDPVIIECGHNFCRACITQCWERSATAASCPQCRETVQQSNLRPNRQLANIVEIAKRLSFRAAEGAGGERVSGEHQEVLKLFCEEDQTPICVVCDRSPTHCAHRVVPVEKAAQEYKEKIQAHWKTLREEREKLLGFKLTGEGKNWEYLKQIQEERQKIVSEFQQLRQFLEEQERLLLVWLEKLDKEIVKIWNENNTKLSEEISRLSELISELEGKYQKPASEFLPDVRCTLRRCKKGKFQQPVDISPELEVRLNHFSQKTVALMEILRKFKDTLPSALETTKAGSLGAHTQANVTLDPDTAHLNLVLSEDLRGVKWEEIQQELPDNPERFDTEPSVLGWEGFTSGRHCWEMEVGDRGGWVVGVAKESVRRRGEIRPGEGIWAVGYVLDQFWALTSPATHLPLSWVPSRIRVCLDCDQGQVTFIDAGDGAPIFTFPPGSVPGERIRPWFWVLGVGSRLRLCP